MTSKVRFNETLQIIEIVHTGILTSENLQKATADSIALIMESGVNYILIDTSNLESVEKLIDLCAVPKKFDESDVSRMIRVALVSPKTLAAREAAQFYEGVSNSRGWLVRPFETHDVAIEWLTSMAKASDL